MKVSDLIEMIDRAGINDSELYVDGNPASIGLKVELMIDGTPFTNLMVFDE